MSSSSSPLQFEPALVESFSLEGLYDYKTLSVHCEQNVKVISAENGSGKTTLLNALYAFLGGKISPLLALNFYSLALKIRGAPEIRIRKDELFPELGDAFGPAIAAARRGPEALAYGLELSQLRDMILMYLTGDEEFERSEGYRQLMIDSPMDGDDIRALCEHLGAIFTASKAFAEAQRKLKSMLGGATVLYLPTYRRIEADLPEFRRKRRGLLRAQMREEWDSDRLIFFGMRDVELRLRAMTSDIRKGTFDAYSKISARTIDQLLWLYESTPVDAGSLDLTTLKLVLARIGKSQSASEAKITELIESGQIDESQYDPLRSFLAQLSEVYQEKRDAEQAIEAFVTVVNRYWRASSDPKELQFDKLGVNVQAVNLTTGRNLPLASLSSGEKQVLSMFARLHLDWEKRYLILIDEPELSLSLEWQRDFLPDVVRTKTCQQLIAITHSPFVFENELDRVSGSLEVKYG